MVYILMAELVYMNYKKIDFFIIKRLNILIIIYFKHKYE